MVETTGCFFLQFLDPHIQSGLLSRPPCISVFVRTQTSMQVHINVRIQKVHQYILYVVAFITKTWQEWTVYIYRVRNIRLGFSWKCLYWVVKVFFPGSFPCVTHTTCQVLWHRLHIHIPSSVMFCRPGWRAGESGAGFVAFVNEKSLTCLSLRLDKRL